MLAIYFLHLFWLRHQVRSIRRRINRSRGSIRLNVWLGSDYRLHATYMPLPGHKITEEMITRAETDFRLALTHFYYRGRNFPGRKIIFVRPVLAESTVGGLISFEGGFEHLLGQQYPHNFIFHSELALHASESYWLNRQY